MLPLIARETLQGGPTLYGVLLAAVGAGAVGGALVLPAIKRRLGANGTVAAGALGTSMVLALFAVAPDPTVAVAASALGGIPTALLVASAGAALMVPLTWRAKLNQGADLDVAPSMHWPEPILSGGAESERGPVMIQIAYDIASAKQPDFWALMRELSWARRRGGGYGWTLMRDAEQPERFVETWYEASWTQHLRHHERVSGADRDLQEQIRALHRGAAEPIVSHFLNPGEPGGGS
ncbi:MAG: MFS transporter [Rhodobacteraceae bacterium]|nr:MFS transporter [Paracoccaceae bacterium]